MGDRILAGGVDTLGTFEPIQLYAGEPGVNGLTTQGTLASGQKVGQLNARNETYKFPVVAELNGKLVAWDPLAIAAGADNATATVTFTTAAPTNGETVLVDGVVFTFKTTPVAGVVTDMALGTTITEAATNLKNAINAYRNTFPSHYITASSAAGVVTVRSPGTAGNAVTLTETGTNIAASAGVLSGGDDDTAALGGANRPVAILPHALDASATGYNADTKTPMLVGGVFNYDALDVPAGTSYAELKRAFSRSPIVIQKLF